MYFLHQQFLLLWLLQPQTIISYYGFDVCDNIIQWPSYITSVFNQAQSVIDGSNLTGTSVFQAWSFLLYQNNLNKRIYCI